MRILVTGGAGFIGSHIVDALIERGDEVVVLDNLSKGKRGNVNEKAELIVRSVTDDLSDIFSKGFDCVVHHAAQMSVVDSVKDPVGDAKTNILGILNLLQNCVNHGVKKFLFSSSGGAIYGESVDIPTKEDAEKNPESPYGISKLTSEYYIDFFRKVHGIDCVVLRYANVYGPRQSFEGEGGVVSIFLNLMLQGKKPKIYGDGKQTRDYIYVKDVVKANLLALEKKEGVFNIGTGKETSVNELYDFLRKIIGFDEDAEHFSARQGELLKSCLDISKARDVFCWEPEYDLEKGLEETVEWTA